jgi:hypothetical protein
MSEPFAVNPPHDRESRREGLITGLLGAAVVALFYLCVDLIRGHALMTPSVLGQAFVLRVPVTSDVVDTGAVVAYTLVHLIAFTVFGLVLTALARASEHSNLARNATMQIVVAFEVFFYGVLYVGAETVRGMFPFLGVLAANTLALLAMGFYLWRRHPALSGALRRPSYGATDAKA